MTRIRSSSLCEFGMVALPFMRRSELLRRLARLYPGISNPNAVFSTIIAALTRVDSANMQDAHDTLQVNRNPKTKMTRTKTTESCLTCLLSMAVIP